MIPNEVLAAWIVAIVTGATAIGGLSLLDSRPLAGGIEAEPLPFYYASVTTGQRPPPLDSTWRARLEATGGLPARPAAAVYLCSCCGGRARRPAADTGARRPPPHAAQPAAAV